MFHYIRNKLTQAQIIAMGYFLVITVGTLLLMLPAATRSGEMATPLTALFTATSATCVTGLVVVDTASYWSVFGQCIILLMIQVGGLGFMTIGLCRNSGCCGEFISVFSMRYPLSVMRALI